MFLNLMSSMDLTFVLFYHLNFQLSSNTLSYIFGILPPPLGIHQSHKLMSHQHRLQLYNTYFPKLWNTQKKNLMRNSNYLMKNLKLHLIFSVHQSIYNF